MDNLTAPYPGPVEPVIDRIFSGPSLEGRRVKTGIAGLDEMLKGGFMRGDTVLVAGGAGTGKTTLGLQYLVNGITKYGENGIYVTFEQLPDQIYRDARSFGWDLANLEYHDKLRLVCTSPDLLLESWKETILDEPIREVHPQRVVIDSLSHLEMFVDERHMRMDAYRIINILKTRGVSPLLVWESQTEGGMFNVTNVGLSFLVDCIVTLRPVEIESGLRKAMVILKMRGSDHDKRLREFEINSNGIFVSSTFSSYEGLMTGVPRRSHIEEAADKWSQAFSKKTKH